MFGFNLLRKILKLFILKNRRIECFDFKIETKIIKKLKLQFNTILIMSWKIKKKHVNCIRNVIFFLEVTNIFTRVY